MLSFNVEQLPHISCKIQYYWFHISTVVEKQSTEEQGETRMWLTHDGNTVIDVRTAWAIEDLAWVRI